ncbi:TPA: hypothetical protein HA242_01400 [Candidatus Woesearchaeota archaeon]|nr:hypothetical protein [Candidatus Woesearchaeota archaeon]HIG93413.1 hypothetical protein [Candidatus Woesearchaeota archaeon]HIH12354.1 hypothetical protein [Candidatus Woesearchaeota archaeon]
MVKLGASQKLAIYGMLVLILLFGLVQVFISGTRKFFLLELIGLGVLSVLLLIGFIGYHKPWGERVLFFVFLLYLVNLGLLWFFKDKLYFVLLLLAVVGFIMSVPRKRGSIPKVEILPEEPHSMVFDKDASKKGEERKGEEKKAARKVSAQFSPGKYVASRRGNTYHEPKCEWSNNIATENRVWFPSKEEAWEKGYKSHSCITG